MTTVFIGGSRAVSRLHGEIRAKLDDLMQKQCLILIGDANGADRAVQQYFVDKGYRDVLVYAMEHCRNNVGNWEVRSISSAPGSKGFAYYAEKDRAMANDARCGVMLWDGKSKGTLNNVHNLLHLQKPVLVYLATRRTFVKLTNEADLQALLALCNSSDLKRAEIELASSSASLHRRQMPLAMEKDEAAQGEIIAPESSQRAV